MFDGIIMFGFQFVKFCIVFGGVERGESGVDGGQCILYLSYQLGNIYGGFYCVQVFL